jgi:hypothetical protein
LAELQNEDDDELKQFLTTIEDRISKLLTRTAKSAGDLQGLPTIEQFKIGRTTFRWSYIWPDHVSPVLHLAGPRFARSTFGRTTFCQCYIWPDHVSPVRKFQLDPIIFELHRANLMK